MKFYILILYFIFTNSVLMHAAHQSPSASSSSLTIPKAIRTASNSSSDESSISTHEVLEYEHEIDETFEQQQKISAHALTIYPLSPVAFLNLNSKVLLIGEKASAKIFNALKNGRQLFRPPAIKPRDPRTLCTTGCPECDFRITLTNLILVARARQKERHTK